MERTHSDSSLEVGDTDTVTDCDSRRSISTEYFSSSVLIKQTASLNAQLSWDSDWVSTTAAAAATVLICNVHPDEWRIFINKVQLNEMNIRHHSIASLHPTFNWSHGKWFVDATRHDTWMKLQFECIRLSVSLPHRMRRKMWMQWFYVVLRDDNANINSILFETNKSCGVYCLDIFILQKCLSSFYENNSIRSNAFYVFCISKYWMINDSPLKWMGEMRYDQFVCVYVGSLLSIPEPETHCFTYLLAFLS